MAITLPVRGTSRSRRAIGTLAMVAIIIAIVSLAQLFQHVLTSHVTDQASNSVLGRAAREVALSAIQEARGVLCERAQKPGTLEFSIFRRTNPPAGTPEVLPLSTADIPYTVAAVSQTYDGSCEIMGLRASLTFTGPISASGSEVDGTLTIEADVRSRLDTSVERRVWRTWGFKVVDLAPTGPLKDIVGWIRSPAKILRARHQVPEVVQAFLGDFTTLIAELRRILAQTDREIAQATEAQLRSALTSVRAEYAPLVEGVDGGSLVALQQSLQLRASKLPPLPSVASQGMMVRRGTEFSPGELDLQGDFDALMATHRQVRDRSIALGQQAANLQTADAAALQVHRQNAAGMKDLGAELGRSIDRYFAFREAFELIATDNSAYFPLLFDYDRYDPSTRLPGLPHMPGFESRSTVLLDSERLTPSPSEALAATFARLGGADGFQGIVIMDNRTTALRLTGAMKGRWTLAVTGSLRIDGLSRINPQSDLFTIIHCGGADTTLSLGGSIEATLVTRGTRMTLTRTTRIVGGLFLEDLDETSQIEPTPSDPERIVPDPVRSGAVDVNLRQVVIAPWTRSLGSARDL